MPSYKCVVTNVSKWAVGQGKRLSSFNLLSQAIPGELQAVLGSSGQESQGPVGEGPGKGHQNHLRIRAPFNKG